MLVGVLIRSEEKSDRAEVAGVHQAAFGGHHGAVVARLVEDLRSLTSGGEGVSLVAEVPEGVVGHAMFTPSLLDAPRRLVSVSVVSPVGVLPHHQRQGVGSAIIERGLAILTERSVPIVFLEGDRRSTTHASDSNRVPIMVFVSPRCGSPTRHSRRCGSRPTSSG